MNNIFLIPIFVPDGMRDQVQAILKRYQEVELWQGIRRFMDDDEMFRDLWLYHQDTMAKRMMGGMGGHTPPFELN